MTILMRDNRQLYTNFNKICNNNNPIKDITNNNPHRRKIKPYYFFMNKEE